MTPRPAAIAVVIALAAVALTARAARAESPAAWLLELTGVAPMIALPAPAKLYKVDIDRIDILDIQADGGNKHDEVYIIAAGIYRDAKAPGGVAVTTAQPFRSVGLAAGYWNTSVRSFMPASAGPVAFIAQTVEEDDSKPGLLLEAAGRAASSSLAAQVRLGFSDPCAMHHDVGEAMAAALAKATDTSANDDDLIGAIRSTCFNSTQLSKLGTAGVLPVDWDFEGDGAHHRIRLGAKRVK